MKTTLNLDEGFWSPGYEHSRRIDVTAQDQNDDRMLHSHTHSFLDAVSIQMDYCGGSSSSKASVAQQGVHRAAAEHPEPAPTGLSLTGI